MGTPPYMPLWVGDYLRDTRNLDTAEHGAYLLLLMTAWTQGGEISEDRKEQYRLAAATTSSHRRAVDQVIKRFWKKSPTNNGSLLNTRLRRELARAQEVRDAQSEAGKRSAAIRWGRGSAGSSATGIASNAPDRLAGSPAPATRPDQNQGSPSTPPAPPQDFSNPSSSPSSSYYASALQGSAAGDDGGDTEIFNNEPAAGADGLINYTDANGGEFIGITEAQMRGWQEMFGESVRNAVNRAALWVSVYPKKRRAIERAGKGFEAFITRWIEDEKRPVGSSKLRGDRVK